MLEHSNGKYVKCAQCYFINTRPVVSRHMQEDHQHYVCDICGAVSKNKGTYYSHRRYHKTYKCGHCDQVFTGEMNYYVKL